MTIRNRKISVKRLLDLILGGRTAGMEKEINKELQEKYSRIIKKLTEASSNFREFITENTPAVYIVDCQDIAQTIVLELSKKATKKQYGTVNKIEATYGGEERLLQAFEKTVIDDNKDINIIDIVDAAMQEPGTVSELANALYKSLNEGTSSIIKNTSILSDVGFEKGPNRKALEKGVFRKVFYDQINGIYRQYIKDVADIMNTRGTGDFEYSKIELKGIELGKKLREKLQSISTFIATDKVVKLPNSLSVVVVANSFKAAVDAVNKNLEAALLVFLSNKNTLIIRAIREGGSKGTGLKFGDLINAGHTAAFIKGTSGKELLGVNMPSAQTAQQTLNIQEAQDLEIELGNLYADINYDVEFLSSFGRRASGGLIDLQFAIAISMPAALNTKKLNAAERAIVKKYETNIKNAILKKFQDKKGTVQKAFVENIPNSSASPSLLENIKTGLMQALMGKDYTAQSSSKNNVKQRLVSATGSTKTSRSLKTKTKGGSAPRSKSVNIKYSSGSKKYPPKTSSMINLVSLLNLINSQLQEQIRKNMGTGNRRDVLNYQTGRFASSVKVERLSESREGMITAFYSYMKNPYATFSKGGRQERPLTRDPKLLIAKSIREIAQTAVANRMRAVNV
jgi:hypothetical protein